MRHALETRGTDAARERLAGLDIPDLWAGTVPDPVARGFAVALEEALSLCDPLPADADAEALTFEPTDALPARDLKRRREFVVSSGGARVRFSRKAGVTLIARAADVVANDCVRFEDRTDLGDLDRFVPAAGQRPRIFMPNFLRAEALWENEHGSRLVVSGRLGRRPDGFPCTISFEARASEAVVRMRVRVHNAHQNHRLRIRFLGVGKVVHHAGTPGWERVHVGNRTFDAGTLVRSVGQLRRDSEIIEVPEAQCIGWIEHEFLLGAVAPSHESKRRAWKQLDDRGH